MNRVNVTRSSMPPIQEYFNEIEPLWESHWLTNAGAIHQKLENALKEYLGVENISLFVNGHSALEVLLGAYRLQSGEKNKIITTPFSFSSTTHAIVRSGFIPVFADIRLDDFTLDPVSVESLIDETVFAVLPVHVYGNLAGVDALQSIGEKYGAKVIYDAAHAFGVRKGDKSSASFGDASMFSFHATKVFNTIEGGAIVYKDPSLRKPLESLKNFGITSAESVEFVGGNAKMNEFCAAMGICNLKHVDEEIQKRAKVEARYRERLGSCDGIYMAPVQAGVASNHAYMPVLFEETFPFTRDDVYESLLRIGVASRKYFYPLINDYECYRGDYSSRQTPVAKYVADRILTLPMYADLGIETVDAICDCILG